MTKFYAYIMTTDSGFAPHCHDGLLSLATCMPDIRRHADQGDYVLGIIGEELSKKANCEPYAFWVYLMKVTEPRISYNDYYKHDEFKGRLDNIYHFEETPRQLIGAVQPRVSQSVLMLLFAQFDGLLDGYNDSKMP